MKLSELAPIFPRKIGTDIFHATRKGRNILSTADDGDLEHQASVGLVTAVRVLAEGAIYIRCFR